MKLKSFLSQIDQERIVAAIRSAEARSRGEILTNHNPRFAPVIHPTLRTGVEALAVAAQAWL